MLWICIERHSQDWEVRELTSVMIEVKWYEYELRNPSLCHHILTVLLSNFMMLVKWCNFCKF